MEHPAPSRIAEAGEAEVAEHLHWLLRLRWLIVPVFVAVDLAHDLLLQRRAPWTALAVGAALLLANGVYAWLLQRRVALRSLLRWARFESALVVAIPVLVVLLDGDAESPLRYGVLVGVVGAAAVLPRTGEVATVAIWAVIALVAGDALALGMNGLPIAHATVARWVLEAGVVITVGIISGYLHSTREQAAARLRATQEMLERQRAEWETAFDGLVELVFVTDREGRVLRANRAFAKLLGARPHELAGRRLAELLAGHPERWWSLPPDGICEIEDPLLDTLVEVTSTRLGDRVIHVARDVGEQRRLYARLVHADKLAAVGVLAAGVAHEINNPTAFVTSNLTELKRYVGAYDGALAEMAACGLEVGQADRVKAVVSRPDVAFARREAARAIEESLTGMERVRQIVGNLRSLARRDPSGEPASAVDLAEVVQAVVRTASADLRSAQATVDVGGPIWVLGHRGELVDVALNLVVNAVQSREEGRPNRIRITLLREGGAALLRVSDTGRGIAPAHMKRLFEPTFSSKAPAEGPGLGLSLARKIVMAHGGALDVASEVGEGSTFTVRLPVLEPEAAAQAARFRRESA
jgi:signal transduction histidine kinase